MRSARLRSYLGGFRNSQYVVPCKGKGRGCAANRGKAGATLRTSIFSHLEHMDRVRQRLGEEQEVAIRAKRNLTGRRAWAARRLRRVGNRPQPASGIKEKTRDVWGSALV